MVVCGGYMTNRRDVVDVILRANQGLHRRPIQQA